MKRQARPINNSVRPTRLRVVGEAKNVASRPTPGWKGRSQATAFANPRPPSVPASLHLTLEEYYASAALMGILAAQDDEPDQDWATDLALETGRAMALKALSRRTRK